MNTATFYDLHLTAYAAALESQGKSQLESDQIELAKFSAGGHDQRDYDVWKRLVQEQRNLFAAKKTQPTPATIADRKAEAAAKAQEAK